MQELLSVLAFPGRLLGRWILFYWLCFTITLPLELATMPVMLIIPEHQPAWLKSVASGLNEASRWVYETKNKTIKHVGSEYLDTKVIIQMTGSGDTRRNYVGCFLTLIISAALAMLWSIPAELLHHWKPSWKPDNWLHSLVRIWVRFFLFQMLMGYGFAKVFPNQFPEPTFDYDRLFGDLTPMGLLWDFMGHSSPYQMFTGAVEVLAGLLLVSRHTTLLGALLTIVAMTQVFLLNMCYDVPVKLYSGHYLLMGLFLAAPDLPRLFRCLILGQAVEAKAWPRLFSNRWLHYLMILLRTALVAAIIWLQVDMNWKRYKERQEQPANPLQGVWELTHAEVDGTPLSGADPLYWMKLDFTMKGAMVVHGPKPPALTYKVTVNSVDSLLSMQKFSDPLWFAHFTYVLKDEALELRGTFNDRKMVMKYKKLPPKKYMLLSKPFKWIHEMPRD
jgi:hypothetical protein